MVDVQTPTMSDVLEKLTYLQVVTTTIRMYFHDNVCNNYRVVIEVSQKQMCFSDAFNYQWLLNKFCMKKDATNKHACKQPNIMNKEDDDQT